MTTWYRDFIYIDRITNVAFDATENVYEVSFWAETSIRMSCSISRCNINTTFIQRSTVCKYIYFLFIIYSQQKIIYHNCAFHFDVYK